MSDRWSWLASSCRTPFEDGGSVVIEETKEDGRAAVTFTAPPGWTLEKLDLDRCAFAWLAEPRSADGIVLARSPQGRWEAHVVECKRTMTDTKWQKVREQLRGSCMRLLAVGGVVGIEVDRITLYTAFRRDQLGRGSADVFLATPPTGEAVERRSLPAGRVSWQAGRVDVDGFGRLPHRRIQLEDTGDDVGRASVSLAADR